MKTQGKKKMLVRLYLYKNIEERKDGERKVLSMKGLCAPLAVWLSLVYTISVVYI